MKTSFLPRALVLATACAMIVGCGGENPEKLLASAKGYIEKNDPKAAVIQLKNALQQKPDMAEARFLLGKALLDSGDVQSASVELRKAYDLKHPPEVVVPLLARALVLEGQGVKLIDQFGGLELGEPASQAALKTSLASAYSMLSDLPKARAALEAALKLAPDHVPALVLKARMAAANRDFDGALAQVEAITAAHPNDPDGWQLKGDLLAAAKADPAGALKAYQEVLKLRPESLTALAGIVAVQLSKNDLEEADKALQALKKLQPKHPQTQYFTAQLAFQKRDFKSTKELLPQLLKSAPENIRVLQLAGAAELYSEGSLVQAETHLSKALQLSPTLPVARRMLVQTYLRSGQSAKALSTLEPLLAAEKPDAQVLAFAGEAHLQNGDAAKAEEFFARAAKLNPDDVRSRTVLALSQLTKGNAEVAFGDLHSIAEADKGVTANLALISALIRRNEIDRALKAIDELERKQPDKPTAANLRGRIQLSRKDMAGARQSFERALTIDPAFFPAVASLAAMDVNEKKIEDAKKRFEAVIARDPKNMQALLALAGLKSRSGANKDEITASLRQVVELNPTEVAPRLLLINHHLAMKEFKQAAAVAQDAHAKLPDSVDILDALGRAQLASGELNQASNSFNKLVGLQAQSPTPHLRLAEVHMASQKPEAAMQSLKRALSLRPDLLEAQSGLIKIAMSDGRSKEAIEVAKSVQKQRPGEPIGFVLEGDIEARRKGWDAATGAYRESLKKAPSSVVAAKLHAALRYAGKAAEAEKFAASWLKDRPNDTTFESYLGGVAIEAKDYASAEGKFRHVVQLEADNPAALNNLAWLMTKLKREGALVHAEKAVALRPDQPAFLDTLAMVLAENNQVPKAIETQKKAVGLRPEDAMLRFNLAKLFIKSGDKAAAKTELESLRKLGPAFAGQDEVGNLLTTL